MSHFSRLLCSTALCVALLPGTATADVTADDVWQNMQDYMATLGGDFSTSTARDGDTLTISESSLAYQLPFDLGQLAFDFSGFTITENGNGEVAIAYANPVTYAIAVTIKDKGSFSTKVDFTMDGYATVASGTPGDVTYTWSVDQMNFRARDVELIASDPGDEELGDFAVTAEGRFSDMAGVSRIQVAELVTNQSSYSFGKHEISFDATVKGGHVAFVGGALAIEATGDAALPRNGMDIMNLAAALRDGLSFRSMTKTTGYHTSQVTEENGVVVGNQSTRVQEQTARYELDQSGLRGEGTVLDASIEMQPGKDLPFPVKFHLSNGRGGATLPMSQSPDLQDVGYEFSLQGLSLSDELWDLVDPQKTLPREPMVVEMDLAARVLNKVDWLDFMTVKTTFDNGEVPVELHEMKLNTLNVDLAGAKLTGSGSGSFDNSDLETFGGFPKPTGVIDLALIGANGLLDSLVAMGMLSDDDAMGARMAAAVFTKPDPDAGEDALTSRLEMNDEGHILANGQRLK